MTAKNQFLHVTSQEKIIEINSKISNVVIDAPVVIESGVTTFCALSICHGTNIAITSSSTFHEENINVNGLTAGNFSMHLYIVIL